MTQRTSSQLNIRSTAARDRATRLAAETGKTVTQIVEEAVQAYRPPPPVDEKLPEGVIRKGRFLVFKADGRPSETIEETLAAIDEDRNRELFYD